MMIKILIKLILVLLYILIGWFFADETNKIPLQITMPFGVLMAAALALLIVYW